MMKHILYFIKGVLIALINRLPDFTFRQYYENMDTSFFDFLNWLFPLDICLDIVIVWVLNLPLVFVFIFIFDFVKDTLVEAVRKVLLIFLPGN